MSSAPARIDERNKSFQRSYDADEIRKKREDSVVELRKKKRLESYAKRSKIAEPGNFVDDNLISFDTSQIESLLAVAEPILVNSSVSSSDRVLALINLIIMSENTQILNAAVDLLRKLSANENSKPLHIIAQTNVTGKLIRLLDHESSIMKFNLT